MRILVLSVAIIAGAWVVCGAAATGGNPGSAVSDISVLFLPDGGPNEYTVSFTGTAGAFTVDARHLRVDITALEGRLLLKDARHGSGSARTRTGPLGRTQQTMIPLTIERSLLPHVMSKITLRLDPETVTRDNTPLSVSTSAQTTGVNVYVPDGNDDAMLRRRYEGNIVYTYGQIVLRCTLRVATVLDAYIVLQPHTKLQVSRLQRRLQTSVPLHAGSSEFSSSDSAFAYKAIDPLVVQFDPAVRPHISGESFIQRGAVAPVPPETGSSQTEIAQSQETISAATASISSRGCKAMSAFAADGWDLGRTITRNVPKVADTIKRGMTHEQVAFLVGFPPIYGTKARLLRLDEWNYEQGARSFDIRFRGDHVASYRLAEQLP